MMNSAIASLILVFFLSLSIHSTSLSSDSEPTWHLSLIGLPVPKLTQTSPALAFLRHSNPSVRLSGRLPSVILTATQSNVLAALNPKDGSIIWRVVLPVTEPIIQHIVDLDSRVVGLVSGQGGTTIRLLTLAEGRVRWERHLSKSLNTQDGFTEGRSPATSGVDIIFSSDRGPTDSSIPDLFIGSHGQKVSRLAGETGEVLWTWSASPTSGQVTRLLGDFVSMKTLEVLFTKTTSNGVYETQITTLSSISGVLQSTRQNKHHCLATQDGPLVLELASDAHSTSRSQAILCPSEKDQITSVRVSFDAAEALAVSSYSEPGQPGTPMIQDIGLGHQGICVAKFDSGHATVLRVGKDGTLQSVWKFTDGNQDAVFAGSIDRDGLPYISRASYAHTLGLGSLEILSLTPTEFTPEGMVTGLTFKHDQAENGNIIHIATEVLQINNYVPYSRAVVVTESGTIQLWQAAELQWERHEDLTKVAATVSYDPHKALGSLLSVVPSNLAQYLSRATWELVAGFLDVQTTQSVLAVRSDHSRVWFVGTSTGRLFALSNDGAQVGKILWKRRLISPDESIAGSASWNQLLIVAPEKQSTRPVLAACLSHTDSSKSAVMLHIDLKDGHVLESSEADSSALRGGLNTAHKGTLALHDRDLGASPARFLGDRGALFKYHNPDLAVRLNAEGGSKTVEVFDQKAGSLVWSFEMESTVDPSSIFAALTENWLVLASRDDRSKGMTHLHSIEWYMSSKADLRLDGSSVNLTTCSRTYMVPYSIRALEFSRSRLGVTSRALLAVNEMDQIVSLSRKFLDCRRPLGKPSKEDMEEQLIMYDPIIRLDPRSVITGDRRVAGLKAIHTFATDFESTSAVIGSGLDLFTSVVAPSRKFDQLGDEFNKAQLILTATGLLVGVLGLRPVVKNKQLRRQWY